MSELKIERVTRIESIHWPSCVEIYRESFPDWEREPEDLIIERIQQGQYLLFVGIEKIETPENVVGFYILDLATEFNYVLFSFLVIAKNQRGKNYGTLMCKEAIRYFKKEINVDWLFIEAENQQAIFYEKLGFRTLNLDYKVPKFGEPGSVKMHLMAINAHKSINQISGTTLAHIITHIFLNAYHLNKNDHRIDDQFALIPKAVMMKPDSFSK